MRDFNYNTSSVLARNNPPNHKIMSGSKPNFYDLSWATTEIEKKYSFANLRCFVQKGEYLFAISEVSNLQIFSLSSFGQLTLKYTYPLDIEPDPDGDASIRYMAVYADSSYYKISVVGGWKNYIYSWGDMFPILQGSTTVGPGYMLTEWEDSDILIYCSVVSTELYINKGEAYLDDGIPSWYTEETLLLPGESKYGPIKLFCFSEAEKCILATGSKVIFIDTYSFGIDSSISFNYCNVWCRLGDYAYTADRSANVIRGFKYDGSATATLAIPSNVKSITTSNGKLLAGYEDKVVEITLTAGVPTSISATYPAELPNSQLLLGLE